MATTKTLTPTNQAITIAAFTEKPDNRVNATNDDKMADAINTLNSNMTYNSGDVFSMRLFHTSGRVINSGKGIFCWLDLAKPCTATGASFEFGNTINVFGIGSVTPTRTVSTISISGNQLSFVIDLSSSHTPGETAIVEFEAKITLT